VILVLFLACCILISVSGCLKTTATSTSPVKTSAATSKTASPSSLSSPSLASVDAATLSARAAQSLAQLKNYYLLRRISAAKSSQADNSDLTTTVVNSQTTLDLEGRGMQMNNLIDVRLRSGQSAGSIINNAIYIKNNYMYVQGYFPDSPDVWSKMELTGGDWSMQNQVRLLIDLFDPQNAALQAPEVIHVGSSDILCSVFKISPDMNKLWAVLTSQPGYKLPSQAPQGITYDQITKSKDISLWLDQSSGLPVQASIAAVIQVGPGQIPSYTGTVTFKVDINMQFSAYNGQIKIDLPAEAAATTVPDLKDLQKAPN
jgi:hypothetical protein